MDLPFKEMGKNMTVMFTIYMLDIIRIRISNLVTVKENFKGFSMIRIGMSNNSIHIENYGDILHSRKVNQN